MMLHLFDRVYLDHHSHLNSKHECLILSQNQAPHPLSKVMGADFGEISSFLTHLELKHEGELELFWSFLSERDPSKRFVIFCDDELFLNLTCQFLKSLYLSPTVDHLYFVYQTFRQDYEMKSLLHRERGERHVSSFKSLFPRLTKEDFARRLEITPAVDAIRALTKNRVSYEHVLGNYFANKTAESESDLKEKILYLAWHRWCNEIKSLKTEVIKAIPNIGLILPELDYSDSMEPADFCRTSPQLQWLFEDKLAPEYRRHLMKVFPPDFFAHIQVRLEIIQWQQFTSDVSFFEKQTPDQFKSRMENLYSSNFLALLKEDINRQSSTDFFKGDQYFNVNHFLVHFLYKNIRLENEEALINFQLS